MAVGEDLFFDPNEAENILKEILSKDDGYEYSLVIFKPTATANYSSVEQAQALGTATRSEKPVEPEPEIPESTTVKFSKQDINGKELEIKNVVIGESNKEQDGILIMVDDCKVTEVPNKPQKQGENTPSKPQKPGNKVPNKPRVINVTPKTGDEFNVTVYLGLMALAAGILIKQDQYMI